MTVKYLHDHDIAHCDLKIDNLLVDAANNFNLLLIDFGYADFTVI